MSDQQGFEFDPNVHRQPPPVVPIRDGLAQPPPRQPPPLPPNSAFPVMTDRPQHDVQPAMVEMAKAVSRIVATRMLLLLAVVTASCVWAYAVYDPTQLRIIAGGVYSTLVVWPLTWLYWKKG